MAYRRRQGTTRETTFEEFHQASDDENSNFSNDGSNNSFLPSSPSCQFSPSLAAEAIRASATHRESSLSSAYGVTSTAAQKFKEDHDDCMPSRNDKGFWGVLAQKAKAILEDDVLPEQCDIPAKSRFAMPDLDNTSDFQLGQEHTACHDLKKRGNPTMRKSLDKITSSLNHISDTFERAFEEGRSIVENKTADIIQETRKLQIRRKTSSSGGKDQSANALNSQKPSPVQLPEAKFETDSETQLKASRDVAMATAAKAKQLLRELKAVKADLAFTKLRCSQLEDENKILRESSGKGDNPADDDLVRLQLETLLEEKARLAHENSVHARENRFLREVVEYHKLTMQDVVYLDESNEEVSEVYPVTRMFSVSPPLPLLSTHPAPPFLTEPFPGTIPARDLRDEISCSSPHEAEDCFYDAGFQVLDEIEDDKSGSPVVCAGAASNS